MCKRISASRVPSWSWRITSPLRILYVWLRFTLSWLATKANQTVLPQPNLLERVRQRFPVFSILTSTLHNFRPNQKSNYTSIHLETTTINFCLSSFNDTRGIGRVTKELFCHLKAISDRSDLYTPNNRKRDVYFFSSIHWCPDRLPSTSIVMIHDVIPLLFPKHFPSQYRMWNERYRRIAHQAKAIVTVSESSASDIARLLEIPDNHLHVIYNGVSKLEVSKNIQLTLPSWPYVVFLGNFDSHKNLEIVLQALRLPKMKSVSLVLVGNNNVYQERITKLGLEKQVYVMGYRDDSEVSYIINGALALVFPSWYEGFGLPPFEAAMLGVPSICSRRPAMTELLEGAALFAGPDQPSEWAACIDKLNEDPKFRDALIHDAHARATTYTWERAANTLAKIFSNLAA